jgi:uncharacterized membrane protein (UPF0182 family)
VIVAYGKHVAMEPTLAEAVRAVFGKEPRRREGVTAEVSPAQRSQLQSAIRDAEQALEQGDWRAFGNAMESLKGGLDTEDNSSAVSQ